MRRRSKAGGEAANARRTSAAWSLEGRQAHVLGYPGNVPARKDQEDTRRVLLIRRRAKPSLSLGRSAPPRAADELRGRRAFGAMRLLRAAAL